MASNTSVNLHLKLARKMLITYAHHIIERGDSRSKAKDELALVCELSCVNTKLRTVLAWVDTGECPGMPRLSDSTPTQGW